MLLPLRPIASALAATIVALSTHPSAIALAPTDCGATGAACTRNDIGTCGNACCSIDYRLKETTDANEQRALLHRARGVWRSLPVPRDAEALTDGRLSTVVGDAADGDKPSAETIAGEGQALFAGK